jgi:hypothetical protein
MRVQGAIRGEPSEIVGLSGQESAIGGARHGRTHVMGRVGERRRGEERKEERRHAGNVP